MSKSRFSIDLGDVKTERPLIPPAMYETNIAKGVVRVGKNDEGVGWLGFGLSLTIADPEIAILMGQDSPKVFFNGFLAFDKETRVFNMNNSPEFGKFIQATGFLNIEDFEEGTEDCETPYDYMVVIVQNMMDGCTGINLMAKVVQVKSRTNATELVNDVTRLASMD